MSDYTGLRRWCTSPLPSPLTAIIDPNAQFPLWVGHNFQWVSVCTLLHWVTRQISVRSVENLIHAAGILPKKKEIRYIIWAVTCLLDSFGLPFIAVPGVSPVHQPSPRQRCHVWFTESWDFFLIPLSFPVRTSLTLKPLSMHIHMNLHTAINKKKLKLIQRTFSYFSPDIEQSINI